MKIKRVQSSEQKGKITRTISWCRKHQLSFNGLYFDEELSGSEGVSITLFSFEDTPETQIQGAISEVKVSRDATDILVLQIPKEWCEQQ